MRRTPIQKRIGGALRRRRNVLNLTQVGFARKLRMDRSYYSAIESGRRCIRITTLERLCLALDTVPWVILKDAER